MAKDAFKIAYDGNDEQLLQQCNLTPYKYLDKLEFQPDEPLLLYQLSTLVHIISERYPQYRATDINGSGFAGLAWDWATKRGKLGCVRATPDPAEVTEIRQEFLQQALAVEMELSKQKNVWARISS
ncbi:hypothetical protein RSOL_009410, partial [Rhizoctonia solani AG-3 Rhs1AP]